MSVFQSVQGLRPGRSVFDLSYEKKFTCDMGELIPVMHDNVVPGDVFDIGYEHMVRAQPLAAPIMHPVYITGHYFFIPWRALCTYMEKEWGDSTFDFERFATGDEDGDDAQTVPTWDTGGGANDGEGTLWDYFGYPLEADNDNARPVSFKHWSYTWVWNEFYRDFNIDTATDPEDTVSILKARWEKDYFTSCLPWQQRGTSPAITGTLSGTLDVTGDGTNAPHFTDGTEIDSPKFTSGQGIMYWNDGNAASTGEAYWSDPNLQVDISAGTVTSTDIESLRLSSAIQRFMELSARTGARYTEHLNAFFGVAPRDDRLQRPEYIGGFKDWLVVSEVIQTAATDTNTSSQTPQGTMVGHAISVSGGHICKYRVQEYGHILALFCIRPKTLYHQGIDRQDLFSTRYELYNPMFAGLAEQEVLTRELYCDGANELTVFGYQGKYDEYRYRPSRVCGDFHADYDQWHMCRQFGAQPQLNSSFLECSPRDDWKASSAEDGFLVSFGNRIRAIRPMPFRANPGIGTL
jgi:hypothetical protein